MTQPRDGIAYSCVVDDVPEIWKCIVPWLATATGLAGIAPERIYVHHACPMPSWLGRLCERLGARTRPVARFDRENPYANKIRQCETDFEANDVVVFSDVDVAFARPFPLEPLDGLVAGKPVDRPNPPIELLRGLFAQAGIAPMGTCANSTIDGGAETIFESILGNFNGGLYVVPRPFVATLGEGWAQWARWLGSRRAVLTDWRRHLDQVAFCMSVNDRRLPALALDNRWNYPAHLQVRDLSEWPFAIHHHSALDGDGALLPSADPQVRAAVDRINLAIRTFRTTYGV